MGDSVFDYEDSCSRPSSRRRRRIRLPENTLNSPLNMTKVEFYLGTKERKMKLAALGIASKLTPEDFELQKMTQSTCFFGDKGIIRKCAEFRLAIENLVLDQERWSDRVSTHFLSEMIWKDVLPGISINLTGSSDWQNELTGGPPMSTWWSILTRHSKDPEVLRWRYMARIMEIGTLWCNANLLPSESSMPESKINFLAKDKLLKEYGWVLSSEDGIPVLFHKFTEVSGKEWIIGLTPCHFLINSSDEGIFWVAPRSVGLCEKDLMIQRWITMHFSLYCGENKEINLPNRETLSLIYKLGDRVLKELGNDGFDVIKLIETLGVSHAQAEAERDDSTFLSRDFFDFATKSMRDLGISPDVANLIDRIITLVTAQDVSKSLEISGLFRHWGHPLIYVEDGLEQVYQNSTRKLNVNMKVVTSAASMMTRILAVHWNKTHPTPWPPGTKVETMVSKGSRILQECLRRRRFPSIREIREIGNDWVNLSLGTVFPEIDEINVLQLIGDKRHAKDLSEIQQLKRRGVLTASVVESFLDTPDIDVLSYLREIDVREEGIDQKYLLICLREKERELKKKGRFFSLMTFRLRLYFTATEFILERYILPLFPEITMCKDQLDFTQQMLSATCPNAEEDKRTHHQISVDFEKWNNFQRHESTFLVFKVLDSAFGWRRVISRTHEFFSRCIVVYAGYPEVLKFDHGVHLPYEWSGHLGGFEGLRQKGWSVVGALFIRLTSEVTGKRIQVLLQGDNQVLILDYLISCRPDPDSLRLERRRHCELTKYVLKVFTMIVQSVGLTTKPEETWMSSHLLYYGKWAFVDGVGMSLILKRICRLFSISNDLVQSLPNALASVHTTCIAATAQSSSIQTLYLYGLWTACWVIGNFFEFSPALGGSFASSIRSESSELSRLYGSLLLQNVGHFCKNWSPSTEMDQSYYLLDMLLRDTCLGGIGGSTPNRYLCRQFQDPLSESLCSIQIIAANCSMRETREILVNIGNPLFEAEVNYEMLLQNPTSLNILGFSRTANLLRNYLKDIFRKNRSYVIANTLVSRSIHLQERSSKELVDSILLCEPKFVRFMSQIYAATPLGQAEMILNKFTSARTVFTLGVSMGDPSDVCDLIFWNELHILFTFSQHVAYSSSKKWECSTAKAMALRLESWGFEPVGVTVPHPLELFSYRRCPCPCGMNDTSSSSDLETEFLRVTCDLSLMRRANPYYTIGEFKPYLGGHTIERRICQTDTEADTSISMLRPIIRLLNLEGWVYDKESNMSNFLQSICNFYIGSGASLLTRYYDIESGSMSHRLRDPRVSDGSILSTSPNIYSHGAITTNTLRRLGRGEENYMIVFQAVFLVFIYRHVMENLSERSTVRAAHLHIGCLKCLLPVHDEKLELSRPALFQMGLTDILLDSLTDHITFRECVPSSMLKRRNPFHYDPNTIISGLFTVPCEEASANELADHAIECLYNGVSLLILSKGGFGGLPKNLLRYDFPSSGLRPLALDPLVKRLLTWALIFSRAQMVEEVFTGKLKPYPDLSVAYLKRYVSGHIEKLNPRKVGMMLMNSGLETAILSANVIHSCNFPVKVSDIGKSFIKCVIQELDKVEVLSGASPPLLLPGDFRSQHMSLIIMRSIMYWQKSINDCRIIRELIEEAAFYLRGIRLGELQKTLNDSGQRLYEEIAKAGNLIRFARVDMKTISSLVEVFDEGKNLEKGRLLDITTIKPSELVWSTDMAHRWFNSGQTVVSETSTVTSPILHLIRPSLHSANGAVKFVSVWKHLGNESFPKVMICGDGNGGFCRVLISMEDVEEVWFNSLPDYTSVTDQGGADLYPSAIISHEQRDKVVNLSTLSEEVLDLRDPEWAVVLMNNWDRKKWKPDIIVSDAELYNPIEFQQIVENLLTVRGYCSNFLIKTHLGRNHLQQSMPRIPYERIEIHRSAYSNLGKYEVYVYLKTFPAHLEKRFLKTHTIEIPDDETILLTTRDIFLCTPAEQVNYLHTITLPVVSDPVQQNEKHRSLDYAIAKTLRLPRRFVLKGRDSPDLLSRIISFLSCCREIAPSMMYHRLSNLRMRALQGLSRLDMVACGGYLLGGLIVLCALISDITNYGHYCDLYTNGMVIVPDQRSCGMIIRLVKPSERKERWVGCVDVDNNEIKRYANESVRYLSGVIEIYGRTRVRSIPIAGKHKKEMRQLHKEVQKTSQHVNIQVNLLLDPGIQDDEGDDDGEILSELEDF